MEWDIAAGHAVLEAAGGSVLTPEGEPFHTARPTRASATAGSWRAAG
jgi:3'-phosphoadenosine 5'-phosphosulfate (PAPS) 3'-phosphatase